MDKRALRGTCGQPKVDHMHHFGALLSTGVCRRPDALRLPKNRFQKLQKGTLAGGYLIMAFGIPVSKR
jgi:hypothetical protein